MKTQKEKTAVYRPRNQLCWYFNLGLGASGLLVIKPLNCGLAKIALAH